FRQSEHTFAQDVALYLVSTAVNRRSRREQRDLLHHATSWRFGAHHHAVGADDFVADFTLESHQITHHQFRDIRLTAGALVGRLRAKRGKTTELLQRVQVRELLAHRLFVVAPEFLRELDETIRGRRAATARSTGTHLTNVIADAVVELACQRTWECVAGRAT